MKAQISEDIFPSWKAFSEEYSIWDWNLETGLIGVSKSWLDCLGYSREEFIPTSAWFNSLVHPDDLAKMLLKMEQELSGNLASCVFHYRLRCKDGTYSSFMSLMMITLLTMDGRPSQMIWVSEELRNQKDLL